jgi:hypothetical protein
MDTWKPEILGLPPLSKGDLFDFFGGKQCLVGFFKPPSDAAKAKELDFSWTGEVCGEMNEVLIKLNPAPSTFVFDFRRLGKNIHESYGYEFLNINIYFHKSRVFRPTPMQKREVFITLADKYFRELLNVEFRRWESEGFFVYATDLIVKDLSELETLKSAARPANPLAAVPTDDQEEHSVADRIEGTSLKSVGNDD